MRKKKTCAVVIGLAVFSLWVSSAGQSPQSPLKILLSNDDGVDAPGLAALAERLSKLGQVTVAASSQNQSGVGHGMTFTVPIMVEEFEKNGSKWYSIDALPATCVRLALDALLPPEKPDLIVAGINRGENVGVVTFSSATVACAREGAYREIPSIAAHLERGESMDYRDAADFIATVIIEMKGKQLPRGTYLNINIPALSKDKIKGVLITRQDTQAPLEHYERRKSPGGKTYFWSIYKPLKQAAEMTDVWALSNGYISITPCHIDQTAEAALKELKKIWCQNLWGHVPNF